MSIEHNASSAEILPEENSATGVAMPAKARNYRGLLSFGTLVALLAIVEACVRGFDIPVYIFPAPSDIFRSLYAGFAAPLASRSAFYTHILTTVSEALGSFVCGSVLGIVLGGLIAEFPLLRRLALPYVIGRLRRNYSLDKDKLGDPDAALAAMYYDTIVQDTRALRYLADVVGADRIMMGSDMPFPIGDLAPLKIVQETSFTDAERASINGGLVQKLFGL